MILLTLHKHPLGGVVTAALPPTSPERLSDAKAAASCTGNARVHSDGIDLTNAAATAIGPGCRVCERLDRPQRAVPPLGRSLRIDQNTSTFVPYPVPRDRSHELTVRRT